VPVPLPLPNALDVVDGSAADVELAESASEFEESACGATAVSTGTDAEALVVEFEDVLAVEVLPDDVLDVLEPNAAPVLPVVAMPLAVALAALEPVAALPVAAVPDVFVIEPVVVVEPVVVLPVAIVDVAEPEFDVPDVP
jgi:hypothetical protein